MAPGVKVHQVTSLELQKLTDIHLRSHLDDELESNGDIKQVYIFSAIALFILLIACINYMNLSTARSALRAKEIGIRKVIGAQRKEIISQFLSESILITWAALVFAMALTALVLPLVNKLSSQQLSIEGLLQWRVLLSLLTLPFVIGLISGIGEGRQRQHFLQESTRSGAIFHLHYFNRSHYSGLPAITVYPEKRPRF